MRVQHLRDIADVRQGVVQLKAAEGQANAKIGLERQPLFYAVVGVLANNKRG